MKVPSVMIEAVKAVPTKNRAAAARLAERVYFQSIQILNGFDDFSTAENEKAAAEAAAAEVRYVYR